MQISENGYKHFRQCLNVPSSAAGRQSICKDF